MATKKQDATAERITTIEFTVEGKPVVLSFDDVTAREAREFRLASGLPFSEGRDLAIRADEEALGFMVWLMWKRDNPRLTPDDVLDLVTQASIKFETTGPDPTPGASS